MRIGKFSEKHGVTQDTIRYYLDIGLLVTKKKGGQYQFSESDSKDMEQIMELKQLDFSLTDIQKILSFQRISGTNTDVFRKLYLPFLEAKKEKVDKELVKYNKMKEYLTLRIDEMKQQGVEKGDKLGIPMSALKILVCPLCQRSLNISDGTIHDNMIMKANIHCKCGYQVNINHGVLIDESAVRTKMLYGKKMPSKEEFLNNSSHVHVNFIYKGMATLVEYINKYQQIQTEFILELDNCVGFFLLQYIKYLSPNSTYILVEYDLERLLYLKRNLEMYYDHQHFIFLCCDHNRLPIAKASIDIAVDAHMTRAFAQSHGEFLLDYVYPLIKDKGLLVGNYLYAGSNSKMTSHPGLAEELLVRERILERLEAKGLQNLELMDIGPIVENSHSDKELNAIERYRMVYAGRK